MYNNYMRMLLDDDITYCWTRKKEALRCEVKEVLQYNPFLLTAKEQKTIFKKYRNLINKLMEMK